VKPGEIHIPKPSLTHIRASQAIGTVFWFWIFYRFYHDAPQMFFGHNPWHVPEWKKQIDRFEERQKIETSKK